MTCKECKYFVSVLGAESGNCRRYPPSWSMLSGQEWSQVLPTEWCGEFEAKGIPAELPTWTDMCWGVRCRNALGKAGISSVAELLTKKTSDLLKLRNFGRTSLRQVQRKLGDYNLALKV